MRVDNNRPRCSKCRKRVLEVYSWHSRSYCLDCYLIRRKEEIGQRIREHMRLNEIPLAYVRSRLGVGGKQMQDILHGRTNYTIDKYLTINHLLNDENGNF